MKGTPNDPGALRWMRQDWNSRASEDAYYYVAFGRRKQEASEFFETGREVLEWLLEEARHLSKPWDQCRLLEIGCGPGRLIKPMASHFGEIHGVDVSDRMIELGRENLKGIPNASVSCNSGADLSGFADRSFDFIYSYAVFQHIPSRLIVLQYLREAVRILRPDGILTCQMNGLVEGGAGNTWDGARMPSQIVTALARELNCQLLALARPGSRYMWTTWRKRAEGESAGPEPESVSLRELRGEICAGQMTEARLSVEGASLDWDLNEMSAILQGRTATITILGAPSNQGARELRLAMPRELVSGKCALQLWWKGKPLGDPLALEVSGEERAMPRMMSARDGVNLLSARIITSRSVKILLENLVVPDQLEARVDGVLALSTEPVCIDQQSSEYEFNVFLPSSTGPGPHRIEIHRGSVELASIQIIAGFLAAQEVFAGLTEGDRLLDLGLNGLAVPLGAHGGSGGEAVVANNSRLPFANGQFQGIACRLDPESAIDWPEIRRVLADDGAVYVEAEAVTDELVCGIERQLGLKYQWRRALARRLSPRGETNGRGKGWETILTWISFGARLADRLLRTGFSKGGAGLYFGRVWAEPDRRARLNGCIRCGVVRSSRQILGNGLMWSRYPLVGYTCGACGARNIFTLDR